MLEDQAVKIYQLQAQLHDLIAQEVLLHENKEKEERLDDMALLNVL